MNSQLLTDGIHKVDDREHLHEHSHACKRDNCEASKHELHKNFLLQVCEYFNV